MERQTDYDIKRIYNVLLLCGSFMLLEIWGHWTSNTLSLLADSIHLLVDFLGFVVSLVALRWTKKKPNGRMTFGYSRVEILGALFSIFLIWFAVGYLILESYHKYKHPHKIDEKIFVVISIIGFFVNLACVIFLHEKHKEDRSSSRNLNIRAAYVHVIGDLIQSIGVLIAGAITYFYPKLIIVDIICTILFSILVLFTTGMVLKDGLRILLEMVPVSTNTDALKKQLMGIENVYEVISIQVWSISANVTSANITLLVEDIYIKEYEEVLLKTKRVLRDEYLFSFFTVQVETFGTYHENKMIEQGVIEDALIEIPWDKGILKP